MDRRHARQRRASPRRHRRASADEPRHLGLLEVTAGDGLAGGQYTATVDAGSFAPISNIANIRLAKRADGASPWALDGTPGTNSGSLVVRTGMSGFSQFGIVGDSGQVPVGLTALSVE